MSKHKLIENDTSKNIKKSRFSIDGILELTTKTTIETNVDNIKTKIDTIPSPSSSNEHEDDIQDEEIEENIQTSLPPKGNWISPGNSSKLQNIICKLEGKDLWTKFYNLSTEMIITKSGRRMFPTVKIRLENCDSDGLYYIFLDVIPVDDRRYRYVYNKSAWLTAGKAEPSPESRLYMHPDSPFPGRQLLSQIISFEKAKLTNNDVNRIGHLVLNSMHKYQPRVHVMRRNRSNPIQNNNRFYLKNEEYKTYVFTETQFMAVTAYQNQLITKLKIEKNPFAKGFRDPSGRSTEMELERHLERLPRFPGPHNPALLFNQFPFPGFPNPGANPDWLFANLAASAVLNNQINPIFPKLPFIPNFNLSNLTNPQKSSISTSNTKNNDDDNEINVVTDDESTSKD